MTDVGRMSVQELVGKVLADEHADVLRQAVVWLAQELMEAEVSQRAGAGYGERNPDRMARRNGYRERSWDTRVGSIELAIPKLRAGSYFPSFLEPRRRSEQALVAVGQEAYVNGVSTRKVDRLVEALGLAGVSKDTVSRLCRGLDEQVTAFRERPLDGAYPYLWLDAKMEKVRAGGRVEHRALVVAYGVDQAGQREVIGLDVGPAETEAFWREFLRSLVRRGLAGVQLVVSDAHQGLKAAIAQVLGAPWQRCTVHFLRDALGHCPRTSSSWSGRRSARSSAPPPSRRPGGCSARPSPTWRLGCPRSLGCCWRPSPTCWPSMPFPLPTAPSCAAPIRWSGSTARSAGAPTLWGCSPTMLRCCGWRGAC
jgi:transposase-like protein